MALLTARARAFSIEPTSPSTQVIVALGWNDAVKSMLLRRELVHQVTGNSAMPRKKGCG